MKRFDNINVIPLIDVMLVLLAIVLTTASFIVQDKLNIELPKTENTESYQPNTELDPLSLAIDQNNQILVKEEIHSTEQLASVFAALPKEQAITLRVDQQANFGTFVEVVDLLKGQNLNNLTILTEKK
ncbi:MULTISPECIES: biopolymer transporter ExbD [Thiomicrorhabdus]|uniref:Biopolymer transporter ExbD n=1 Tax=Thiomicrorhabdus xiamenensis TaxID=2739063 RepID=A0A7D4T1K8_9GAMM|nr:MULTISPECIES: biopolymer transporter ExbD [Thiomicrorhabdus]MBO1924427.1 biopolymer transporter ExbD [Thiomicrorhabdus sp. 6S3-12]QKI89665.1 biopolymer transporter ExbD [Thiomicrorhabdus xiamenensis]